jgi:hypothetical protein
MLVVGSICGLTDLLIYNLKPLSILQEEKNAKGNGVPNMVGLLQ